MEVEKTFFILLNMGLLLTSNLSCCESFKNRSSVNILDTEYPAFIKSCVESIAKKESFISHSTETKKIITDGGNYLGALYEVDIKGKTKNEDKEINLFVKNIVPMTAPLGKMFSLSGAYLTECYVYKDLSKIFIKLQDEAGVPEVERYKIPKGYDESSSEGIIMENMAIKGFTTRDRMKSVPLKFVELSVQQLAKFHGLGFAIQKKMPDYYEMKISKIDYPFQFNKAWYDFFNNMAKTSSQDIKEAYKKKVEGFVLTATDKMRRYLTADNDILTLCHGDYKADNMLMKEEEGEVTQVVPLDYQFLHHGCPVNDLLYFIYGCTDSQMRRTHMTSLLELYYTTLRDFLKYFEIDVSDVYPRQKFETALKEREDYSLALALLYFPFFYAPEDIDNQKFALSPIGKERIEEIIQDLDVLGLI